MELSSLTYEVRRPPRWNTFVAGLAIDVVGVLLLTGVDSRLTDRVAIEPIATNHYIALVAPITAPLTHRTRQSIPVPVMAAKREAPKLAPPLVAHVKSSQIDLPKPELPKIAAATSHPIPNKPLPNVDVFAARAEVATVHQPPRAVQTGGFGDPNSVPGQGDPKRRTVSVASVGSFELPAGTSKGNGTGGAQGVSVPIRAAGFNDVRDAGASPGPHGRGNGGSVVQGEFGDAVAPNGTSAPQRIQKKLDVQPVEIVYKPRPVYTAEARRKGVEGEVLLDVVFGASGSLHINRVVKGLGYGLDDSALAAAQHIRFRPARRDGQPYDCAALVHIVFELSE